MNRHHTHNNNNTNNSNNHNNNEDHGGQGSAGPRPLRVRDKSHEHSIVRGKYSKG